MDQKPRGRDLFIVDNSVSGWTGLRYLEEWTDIARGFDIATGNFEIGALLALDGKWQKLDKIRILMGAETTQRTRKALLDAVRAQAVEVLNNSIEVDKQANPFLAGVPAILEAMRSGQIECRVYDKDKFHAKAYITHARIEVVGSQALVGSSNFSAPGLTKNIELNVQIQSAREVAQLQEWFETHWQSATEVTEAVIETIERHTRLYSPFAETTCGRSPWSIMGFITNHSFIENPTLRGLRRSLLGTFSSLWFLDLHGNSKRKERCPLPVPDQNVFDIQQGVAVSLMIRRTDETAAKVHWGELWGSRDSKYDILQEKRFSSLSAVPVLSMPELYLFFAQDDELRTEFDAGLPLDRIFATYSTGIATARDSLTVHFKREELHATVHEFSSLPPERARKQFELGPDTNDWKVPLAIRDLKNSECSPQNEHSYQYRPFDRRFTYYTGQARGFLFARTIEEYQRDFLKEQFLAALHGRQWIQREDAIRAFARWMGFRRTGPAIENMARSLINGLLREGSLEGDSLQIRRCGQDV
jgi:Type ISP C-terminal specificity domain/PLD-like domain